MSGGREVNDQWAAWLRTRMRRSGLKTPTELARASGVDQSVISRWLNEGRTPQVDQLRKVVEPLNATMLEILIGAGYVRRDEVDSATLAVEPASVADAIAADADLIDEARVHLLNQYALLRRLSPAVSEPASRKTPRRAQTPPDRHLEAVAQTGDPSDRAEMERRAREVRKRHPRKSTGTKRNDDD